MKCLNEECDAKDIAKDDNFCYKCGHWTASGYKFINAKENVELLNNGDVVRQEKHLFKLISLVSIGILLFLGVYLIKGNDIYRSYFFIKRSVDSYLYGYNVSIIKTDNIYNDKEVDSLEEALYLISYDLDSQSWKCSNSMENFRLEADLEKKYDIASVDFCDLSYNEANMIVDVIDGMYELFPNIKGALTNISITNAKTNSEYIAYFQPSFEFVNPNNDIKDFNKVSKTQILLNSYYFLNESIRSNPLSEVIGANWYVSDATWESTIAHELGHYITFFTYLKANNIDNVTFITKDNEKYINDLLEEYDNGVFQTNILRDALNNYNLKHGTDTNILDFLKTISMYASAKNKDGVLIPDEAIAEAIHDYYLHNKEASEASLEIVKVIKSKL